VKNQPKFAKSGQSAFAIVDWKASDPIIAQDQVPAVALESQPGDVVAFNHNLMHAAFGGSQRRRMFTMNTCAIAQQPTKFRN
jgi:ectoine hydroxylase-related dioxygenase (phytanoyl-CoA dioxygenase family)